MGRTAQVVIVAGTRTESDLAMARLRYGVTGDGNYMVPKNATDFTNLIRGYESVGKLVFELHGIPGNIEFSDSSFTSIDKITDALKGTKLQVTDGIYYEGCSIAEVPKAIISLMLLLKAPKTVGYDAFHFWGGGEHGQGIEVKVERGMKEDDVKKQIKLISAYLMAGQPTAAAIARSPATYRLTAEWFSKSIGDNKFPMTESAQRTEIPYSKLVPLNLSADKLDRSPNDGLGDPGGPLHIVTVNKPPATATPQKP